MIGSEAYNSLVDDYQSMQPLYCTVWDQVTAKAKERREAPHSGKLRHQRLPRRTKNEHAQSRAQFYTGVRRLALYMSETIRLSTNITVYTKIES